MTLARAVALASLAAVGCAPVIGLLAANVPTTGRAIVAAVAILALARPQVALLVVAASVPLGGVLGTLLDMPHGLTEPLVLAFLGGWLGREAIGPTTQLSQAVRRILTPVILLATVVGASAAVGLAAQQPFVAYPLEFLRELVSFLWSGYFADPNRFPALTAALRFLEGLGLFAAAVVLTQASAGLAMAVARVTVAGATGVAALSLNRLAEVVVRGGGTWQTLAHHLVTIRISVAFLDVNAAGSYFAMAAVLAVGLGIGASRRRWGWMVAASLLAAALWLTGSRAALFAVLIAGAGMLVVTYRARESRRGKSLKVVTLVALLLIGVAAIPFAVYDPDRAGMGLAMKIRWHLVRAALAMAASQPVFGVGIGGFKALSGGFFGPELLRYLPSENAHNYFLQVLAELGVAGFGPFVLILGGVGRHLWSGATGKPINWAFLGGAGGLLAFVVTWLAGHPLLITEVSCAFWIFLGSCAGLAGVPRQPGTVAPATASPWRPLLPAAFVMIVALTLPSRVTAALAGANLEGAAIGCSAWQSDETGGKFRWLVAQRAQFFVPADASGVRVPFRLAAADPDATVLVTVYLDGRLTARMRLAAGTWRTFALVLPGQPDTRFHRVEVEVGEWHAARPPTQDAPGAIVEGVQVGKPALTSRRSR